MVPALVIAGSVRTSATWLGARAASRADTSLNWIDLGLLAQPAGKPEHLGNHAPFLLDDQRLLKVPVVLPVEHQNDGGRWLPAPAG